MELIYEQILKLLLAVVLSGLIGIEREKAGKPVGVRTLALVCIGSTLATIIASKYFPTDTLRVISGIVTGIGFLGAGAIIAKGKDVKGLTTAASIWVVAIIGIGVGIGEYLLSIIVAVLVYIILVIDWLRRKVKK